MAAKRTVLEELIVKLGYEFAEDDKKSLTSFVQGTKQAAVAFTAIAGAATAAGTALTYFAKTMADSLSTLGFAASRVDVSVEMLSALEYAATQATGSADGLAEALGTLSRRAAEAVKGQGDAAKFFGQLGVQFTTAEGGLRRVDELLLDISDAIRRRAPQEQIQLAEQLGLGEFVLLLRQGSQGIRELITEAAQLGIVTQEDVLVAQEFRMTWNAIARVFQRLKVDVLRGIGPEIQAVVKEFVAFFQANREFITTKLVASLAMVARTLGNIVKFLTTITINVLKLTDSLFGLENVSFAILGILEAIAIISAGAAIVGIGNAIIWLTGLMQAAGITIGTGLLLPIAKLVALAALLVLVFDDLAASLRGDESVLKDAGEWIDKITGLSDELNVLWQILNGVAQAFRLIFGKGSVDEFLEGIDRIDKAIMSLTENRIRMLKELAELVSEVFGMVFPAGDAAADAKGSPAGDAAADAKGSPDARLRVSLDSSAAAAGFYQQIFRDFNPESLKDTLASLYQQASKGGTQVTQNVEVTVDGTGAATPETLGSTVATAISRALFGEALRNIASRIDR